MNIFSFIFLSKEQVIQILSKEYDKIRVYFVYIPKMNLEFENPLVSKPKIVFLEIRKGLHLNPKLFIQVPPPNTI